MIEQKQYIEQLRFLRFRSEESTRSFRIEVRLKKNLSEKGNCEECVFAGQNVFLGSTTHLPRPECYVESHHLHLIYLVHCYFQMRFQKRH